MFAIILIPFLAAMFLAINMGGSGTAPSFSAAYGASIIRKGLIPGLFGLFVFFGAIIAGKRVILTIGRGILPEDTMSITMTTIILSSVAISLLIANLLKIPQSTSQSTIFALVGPALYFNVLKTDKLFFEIIPAWFILPIFSFVITLVIGTFIYKPLKQKGIIKFDEISNHHLLKVIVILASCYVAFAIGSNNVANAAGPLVPMILNELNMNASEGNFLSIMILSTLIIAPCFAIGSSIFGSNLARTTGKEIIRFGPFGAVLVSIVTASLLLLASVTKGIPTSLVQLNTAAIIGLGISKTKWKEIFARTAVKRLLIVWIMAPLISLSLSFMFTVMASKFGLL